jgi:YidC/Oxa1 family membrane protein insertase
MFTTIIVRPIFNLLSFIYAILPGHNFGLAIIIFTIIIRLLMWPLVKKQLRQARAMRDLQPEIKRIKQQTKGNKQRESAMIMELYKEREVSPFGSIGTLIIQLIILLGLYSGLRRVVSDPTAIVSFSYPFIQHLGWIQQIAHTPSQFHSTLFGLVNLTRSALGKSGGGIYWPAMIIVTGSAITQYFQGKQLMPTNKDSRKLRDILKDAGTGQKADQSEVSAAVGRSTRYFLPVMVFLFTVSYPSALSLYWLVGGLVAFIQQSIVLREDVTEIETASDAKPSKDVNQIVEGEVIEQSSNKPKNQKSQNKKSSHSRKKRRKR